MEAARGTLPAAEKEEKSGGKACKGGEMEKLNGKIWVGFVINVLVAL